VDDIDSFLTPEVLSRSHSNERTLLYNREDEEQEDEQYIQLPSQHYVSSFHGDRLVSADVELITIDDSDEEEGATQVVGNRPSPQSELDELQHPEKDELCDFPREEGSDVIGPSSVAQEALFEQASQPLEGLQVPSSDRTQEHDGEFPYPLYFTSIRTIICRGNIEPCQLEQSSCVPYWQACISIRTPRNAFS